MPRPVLHFQLSFSWISVKLKALQKNSVPKGGKKSPVREKSMEKMLLSSDSSSSSSSLLSQISFEYSSSSSSSSSADEDQLPKQQTQTPLPLLSLNHVSFVCKSVTKSVRFYEEVLGFVLIKRPSSFTFEGAWLFNHGIGIHLLEAEDAVPSKQKAKINPKDNHISFQCTNMDTIVQQLEEKNIEFVTAVVEEGGITVDQLFFHDPDGYMIEICNCQNLPVLPLSAACPLKKIPRSNSATQIKSSFLGNAALKMQPYCSGEVEALMMENLALDMINISY